MPKRGHKPMPLAERFWPKVHKRDGCWLWTASTDSNGYGQSFIGRLDGRVRLEHAHRVAWRLTFGDIPDGLNVLHRCDVPRCVNPAHLFLGTDRDNIQDAIGKGRWISPWRLPHLRDEMIARKRERFRNGEIISLRDHSTGRILGTRIP